MKLRNLVGSDLIGANFDPSHLFWQGIDPVYAIRYLGKAIYFFHAKDNQDRRDQHQDPWRAGHQALRRRNPPLWIFRSVGYGHDYLVWKDMMARCAWSATTTHLHRARGQPHDPQRGLQKPSPASRRS